MDVVRRIGCLGEICEAGCPRPAGLPKRGTVIEVDDNWCAIHANHDIPRADIVVRKAHAVEMADACSDPSNQRIELQWWFREHGIAVRRLPLSEQRAQRPVVLAYVDTSDEPHRGIDRAPVVLADIWVRAFPQLFQDTDLLTNPLRDTDRPIIPHQSRCLEEDLDVARRANIYVVTADVWVPRRLVVAFGNEHSMSLVQVLLAELVQRPPR